MSDKNRFSVFILEKDVLEYNYFKNKFNEYDNKTKAWWRKVFYKESDEKNKMDFYDKYISKMKYLEKHYRKTNVYTKYHAEIEQPYLREEPVQATQVDNIVSVVPTAPVLNQDYDY